MSFFLILTLSCFWTTFAATFITWSSSRIRSIFGWQNRLKQVAIDSCKIIQFGCLTRLFFPWLTLRSFFIYSHCALVLIDICLHLRQNWTIWMSWHQHAISTTSICTSTASSASTCGVKSLFNFFNRFSFWFFVLNQTLLFSISFIHALYSVNHCIRLGYVSWFIIFLQ